MHTQRVALGIAGIFVSLFLIFSGFTISASRVAPVTFGPQTVQAGGGGGLFDAILTAVVIAVAVYTFQPEFLSFGVAESVTATQCLATYEAGFGLVTGIETALAANVIGGVINATVLCVSGLICGDDGGNPDATYSVAAGTATGGECYGPVNSCGQAYKGTYEEDPSTGLMGCKIGDSFSYGQPPASSCPGPSVDLSFALGRGVIDSGQSTTLTWNSPDATSCQWTGGFDELTVGPSGSVSTGPLTQTSTYQIKCSNDSGTGAAANVTVTVMNPEVTISANPVRVRAGVQSTITWNGKDVKSCTVTSPSGQTIVSGDADENHVFSTGSPFPTTISTQSVFRITCETNGDPMTKSALVNVVPLYQEF